MNISWYAVIAALCGVVAVVLAGYNLHMDAITLALLGVILALLSHRDA